MCVYICAWLILLVHKLHWEGLTSSFIFLSGILSLWVYVCVVYARWWKKKQHTHTVSKFQTHIHFISFLFKPDTHTQISMKLKRSFNGSHCNFASILYIHEIRTDFKRFSATQFRWALYAVLLYANCIYFHIYTFCNLEFISKSVYIIRSMCTVLTDTLKFDINLSIPDAHIINIHSVRSSIYVLMCIFDKFVDDRNNNKKNRNERMNEIKNDSLLQSESKIGNNVTFVGVKTHCVRALYNWLWLIYELIMPNICRPRASVNEHERTLRLYDQIYYDETELTHSWNAIKRDEGGEKTKQK